MRIAMFEKVKWRETSRDQYSSSGMPRTDGVERGGRRPPLSLELFRLLQDHKESGELHCRNNPFNYNLIGDFFTFSPLPSVGSGQALRKGKTQHSTKYYRWAAFDIANFIYFFTKQDLKWGQTYRTLPVSCSHCRALLFRWFHF